MIRRYYGVDEVVGPAAETLAPSTAPDQLLVSVRARHLVRLIRSIDALPTLPATVQRCQEALANPDTSTRQLARTIEQDPTLAADLLRTVNSVAFGLSQHVSDIAVAVSLLGVRDTYALVLASTIPKLFEMPAWFDLAGFRQASIFCATACKALGGIVDHSRSGCFFAAGLLHDLGRVVLALVAPVRYARIADRFAGLELIAAEEETLGISHPEAGYILARNWGLPTELAAAVRFHANPEAASEARSVVETVALVADVLISHVRGSEEIVEFADRNTARIGGLGLSKEGFVSIIDGTKAVIDEAGGAGDAKGFPVP
jgi:HD-like signal output (HDOD) protein